MMGLAIAIGAIIPATIILGILAAIAIPACQDYSQRALVGECLAASAGLRQAVSRSWQETGRFPGVKAISKIMPDLPIESDNRVIDVDTASDQIVLTFKSGGSASSMLQGNSMFYTFELVENRLEAYCESNPVPDWFLPGSCQRVN